ncbi:MAG: DUF1592 domain-containing protein, partial [Planctomycetota bacterium]
MNHHRTLMLHNIDCRISFSRMFLSRVVLLLVGCWVSATSLVGATPPSTIKFLRSHCADCHGDGANEGDFDLDALLERSTSDHALQDEGTAETWVKLFDRVEWGEMPPPDAEPPDAKSKEQFLNTTGDWIPREQRQQHARRGRVHGRRLTAIQIEKSLHDVLGIDIPLANRLPADPKTNGYTTVADGQPMSHFQMLAHLDVVDTALNESLWRIIKGDPEDAKRLDAQQISRRKRQTRCREPEVRQGAAVVWNSRLVFYGRIPATTAPEDGWYQFDVSASCVKTQKRDDGSPKDLWCTIRRGKCISSAPLMTDIGVFETAAESRKWSFTTWLPAGHMVEIRPADAALKVISSPGGQITSGMGETQNIAGVAIEHIDVKRVYRNADAQQIRRRLFGDWKVQLQQPSRAKRANRVDADPWDYLTVTPRPETEKPLNQQIKERLRGFAKRAFRSSVTDDVLRPYFRAVMSQIEQGQPPADALVGGYRSLLCSVRFLYLMESNHDGNTADQRVAASDREIAPLQPLSDHAIANRLSYFLTQSPPDAALRNLANEGRMRDPVVLRQQVRRLLKGPRGDAFIGSFADQWLQLDQIDSTEPDKRGHPNFDSVVKASMILETRRYLSDMLQHDRDVSLLVDSRYAFLNSRLARYYGIDLPQTRDLDDTLKKITVPGDSSRGGLITQGAILKVTANGTDTSPVVRGAWLCERILGIDVPPPPPNVPAIEPDVRGTKTIREMLAKHRDNDQCASCHRRLDPPGFAL